MDIRIECFNNKKRLGSRVKKTIVEASKFCNECISANRFTVHNDHDNNSYMVGVRLSNNHIDWLRVDLIPIQ